MTDYKELIERMKFQTEDTISDHAYIHVLLMEAADAIEELMNATIHESCTDCPLYDQEHHNCPRFNKVIPRAIEEATGNQEVEQSTEVQDILQYLDECLHPIVSPEHWSVYSELYDMVSMLPSAERKKGSRDQSYM